MHRPGETEGRRREDAADLGITGAAAGCQLPPLHTGRGDHW